jgi:hypothetical protein
MSIASAINALYLAPLGSARERALAACGGIAALPPAVPFGLRRTQLGGAA